jgi:hypothetical protein
MLVKLNGLVTRLFLDEEDVGWRGGFGVILVTVFVAVIMCSEIKHNNEISR